MIANRYSSSVKQIVTATGLEDPNLIYRGQVLTVPVPSAEIALQASPILTGSKESLATIQQSTLPAAPLLAPADGAILSAPVTLQWRWGEQLADGQFFAIHLWRDDQPGPCCLSLTTDLTYTLDLDGHPPALFSWTVRVVEGRESGPIKVLERFLTPPGKRFTFFWTGPGS